MAQIASSIWILVIFLGATLIAVGNIYYPLSREREQKMSSEKTALSILQPELQVNLKLLKEMKGKIHTGQVSVPFSTDDFKITAWATVSNSNLLQSIENDKLHALMRAYHLIYQANTERQHLFQFGTLGVDAAIPSREQKVSALTVKLEAELKELEPLLQDLVSPKKKEAT